jgi:hypothetical protein
MNYMFFSPKHITLFNSYQIFSVTYAYLTIIFTVLMKFQFPVVGSKFFSSQMGKMNFTDCVAYGVKSKM